MAPFSMQLLADIVLVMHFGIVVFVIGGLVAIFVGNSRGWRWVNRLSFRLAHLAAIGIVVAESWFGVVCPLTALEAWLRAEAGAGASTYSHSFIEYWVQRMLYFDAPPWVFTTAYTAFGILVAAAWWHFPPRKHGAASDSET